MAKIISFRDPLAHHDGDVVIAAEGAESLPSYVFSGDLNTGMWRPDTNKLAWSLGGTEKSRLDSDGLTVVDTLTTKRVLAGGVTE